MKLATIAVFAVLGACANPEDYPLGGGGGGNPTGTGDAGVDGGPTDGGDMTKITGRVCLLTDFRDLGKLDKCEKSAALGLSVTLGDRSATTTADGSFSMVPPSGTGFVWHVSTGTRDSPRVVRSAMPFGTNNVIPAMQFDRYADLVNSNGGTFSENADEGSIIVRIVKSPNGAPVANLSADTTLANDDVRLYDTDTKDVWAMTATGKFGIAWIPRVAVTPTNPAAPTPVTLTNQAGMEVARPSVAVESLTVTYITQEIP